jgi:2,4-dienoyl-CoA reductase (NADPH2)
MPYSNIFKSGHIGKMELANRIVMAPMGSNYAETDGTCGERIQSYYEARAAGGAGLLIMGVVSVGFPHGTAEPYQVGISDDKYIPGLSEITRRVHAHGSKIAVQLQHAGKTSVRDIVEGRPLLVPSIPPHQKSDMMLSVTPDEIARFVRPNKPPEIRVMEQEDIQKVISWFTEAAIRAKKSGFDGIEIHAAHSYVIAGFLSAYYNHRTDEYGGPIENRARLLLEVIQSIRTAVGADFPVWIRLDAYELRTPGGITLEDAKIVAKMAEEAGVDAIHVSAYATITTGSAFTEAPLVHQPGGFLNWASEIKKIVSIPIITAGRIDQELGESAIKNGQTDFIALGRKLLADPELPNKWKQGDIKGVRPCIYCYTCVSEIFVNERVRCAVNVATGHEFEWPVTFTEKPKKVIIIGGGPAGMEAARVAAQRGHQVTLVEKTNQLGGTLNIAAMAYSENGLLLDYLINQMRHPNIQVKLNTSISVQEILKEKPDEVMVATGAKYQSTQALSKNQKNAWDGELLRSLLSSESMGKELSARLPIWAQLGLSIAKLSGLTKSYKVLQRLSKIWLPFGKNIVIVGGGLVGCELAELLVERNRKVTILEDGTHFAKEIAIVRRWKVLDYLKAENVTLLSQHQLTSIQANSLKAFDAKNQKEVQISFDDVIIANNSVTGRNINSDFEKSLIENNVRVTNLGDYENLGYISNAMATGFQAGRSC